MIARVAIYDAAWDDDAGISSIEPSKWPADKIPMRTKVFGYRVSREICAMFDRLDQIRRGS